MDNNINQVAREVSQLISTEHEARLSELLKKYDLLKDGEALDDKILASRGYTITHFVLPDHTYRFSLAKIIDSVEYKAEIKCDLETSDMPDTTFEDTDELRAKRAEAADVEATTSDDQAVTEDEKAKTDESSEANE